MPPPLQRDRCRASCLRRACVVPATCVQRWEDDKPPPPPHTHTPPPPQGWGKKVGRGGQRPPPPEDKAARWGGSGERVRDGPHDRARRKHAPCKPQRGGHRGCERRVGRATTGATQQPPPPCRGTSAAPRACAVLATCLRQRTDSEDAPRPPPSPPPTQERGEDSEETARGHGEGQRTDRRAGGETGGGRWRRKKKNKEQSKPTCQGKNARRQGPIPRRTGGGRGDMGPQEKLVRYPTSGVWGPQRRNPPPPPTAAKCLTPYLRRACVVPATCVLRREDDKGAPPPPPPPHTTAPPRVGDDGSGTRTPPEDKAAGWRGSGERVRDGPHDRAQREHAPCTPQRGDHRGCDRRVGRATTGATRQAPPPPAEGQVPRLVPAPCSRRAYARGQAARTPPPTPFSSTHPRKGRGQRGDSEGTWGGAEDRPKRRGGRRVASGGDAKKKNKGHQRARAGTDSRGRRDTAGARKHGKGRGKGGHPWGRKLGGGDQHRSERGGGGVTRARKRRW